MTCPSCFGANTSRQWSMWGYYAMCNDCGHCWVLESRTSAEAAKPSEDTLMCPKPGCQRHKPFENAEGRLECWWCGHTGSWHDFPPIPNQSRERDTSSEGDGRLFGLDAWLP